MGVDKQQIDKIVSMVVSRLQQEGAASANPGPAPSKPDTVINGLFQQTDKAVQAASKAQKQLLVLPLAVREEIIQAVREVGLAYAERYARMEFEETGLGKEEDNVKKVLASCRVLGMEDLTPEVFSGDKGVTIIERVPVGVIASVNPVTNGAPTILFNTIMMLAGGNTVINNPHPKTKKVSAEVIKDLNKAIVKAGGPPNAVCCFDEPSVGATQGFMTHPLYILIWATGRTCAVL